MWIRSPFPPRPCTSPTPLGKACNNREPVRRGSPRYMECWCHQSVSAAALRRLDTAAQLWRFLLRGFRELLVDRKMFQFNLQINPVK